jgi:mycofactocin glycosyltransferase
MFKNSDVTLYIPCFNASATTGRCLAGISAQTVHPAEVLLVDDGSKPAVKGIVSRVVRHDVNLGLGAARNTALRSCNTPLLASLDADIVPEPDWLETVLAVLNREKADGVGGKVIEH